MSLSNFLRAIFCQAPSISSPQRKIRKQRRHRNKQLQGNNQPPPRRWCDPVEGTSRTHTTSVTAPSTTRNPAQYRTHTTSVTVPSATYSPSQYPSQYRTQQLVPARPLRKPLRPRSSATQESRLPAQHRQSAIPRPPSQIPHTQRSLRAGQVAEVITTVGKTFPHFPCVVTGLAAMVYHGFNNRLPREVSLSFPARYHEVIRSWALSQGLLEIQDKPNSFGVVLSEGEIRCIRARFLEHGFEAFRTVRAGDRAKPAKVLNLPTIAVQIAKGYVAELNTADLRRQEVFAGDMRWTLRAMQRLGQVLRPFYACRIVEHSFWEPFTLSFPDTLQLFAKVGLGLREVEALQSATQQYGEM